MHTLHCRARSSSACSSSGLAAFTRVFFVGGVELDVVLSVSTTEEDSDSSSLPACLGGMLGAGRARSRQLESLSVCQQQEGQSIVQTLISKLIERRSFGRASLAVCKQGKLYAVLCAVVLCPPGPPGSVLINQ